MNNVKKTIGWADYTINPVKGLCPVGCSYCYARRLSKRFKWNPEIRFEQEVTQEFKKIPSGSRLFIGSTIELFHEDINPLWINQIIAVAGSYMNITPIFLTKCPENLIKYSPFPDNSWVGASVTHPYGKLPGNGTDAFNSLMKVEAKVKFISFEPLQSPFHDLTRHYFINTGINWIIIGAQTPYSNKTAPRIEWLQEIMTAADKAGIPVFLKSNLHKVFEHHIHEGDIGRYDGYMLPKWAGHLTGGCRVLRQEFPDGQCL